MNATNLLDDILGMLRTFRDDRAKLEKLHKFIREEIYEEPPSTGDALQEALDEDPEISDRYKPLLNDVGQSLGMGMICYINPDTLEVISIPENVTLEYFLDDDQEPGDEKDPVPYDDNPFHEDLKRIQREWTGTIVIEPPQSFESFKFMEGFVYLVSDSRLRNLLSRALQGRKPFRSFNGAIHDSEWLDKWYAYRQKCLELYAAGHLRYSEGAETPQEHENL